MAPAHGRSLALIGSARILGLSAILSAALHLIVLAAIGGLIDLPRPDRPVQTVMATLVNLPPPEASALQPIAGPEPPSATKPTRRSPVVPTIIAETDSGSAPVIISRARSVELKTSRMEASADDRDKMAEAPSPPAAQPLTPAQSSDTAAPASKSPEADPAVKAARRIFLEYALKSSIVDGHARYLWTADATTLRYTIEGSMEADGFFASMFAGRFEQSSKGQIVPGGLRPDRFSLRRGEAPAEIARFDWSTRQISHQRIRGDHVQPLSDNAQDLQSFIFQFSHEFGRPVQPERVSFAITNARKLDNYEFRVAGRERLRLSFGEVDTLHLVRITQDPGDAYEAWISPAHLYLPVKIRFMLSGRFPVEQLVTRIDIEP